MPNAAKPLNSVMSTGLHVRGNRIGSILTETFVDTSHTDMHVPVGRINSANSITEDSLKLSKTHIDKLIKVIFPVDRFTGTAHPGRISMHDHSGVHITPHGKSIAILPIPGDNAIITNDHEPRNRKNTARDNSESLNAMLAGMSLPGNRGKTLNATTGDKTALTGELLPDGRISSRKADSGSSAILTGKLVPHERTHPEGTDTFNSA